MKLRIEAVDSPGKSAHEFTDDIIVLGRDAVCDLALPGVSAVSGRHAQISLTPEGAFLSDVGSTNGTFVNDRRIEGRIKVRPGDYFRLGHTGPSFKITEIDLTRSAPAPRFSPPPEPALKVAILTDPEDATASLPLPPRPRSEPRAQTESPAPTRPAPRAPTGPQGQTRMMVMSLQNKNRNLTLGVSGAVLLLLFAIAGTGIFFMVKTRKISSDNNDLINSVNNGIDELKGNMALDKKAPDGQQLSDQLRRSTVWINSPDGSSGSGMLVNEKDRIIVTNYHVVAKPKLSRLEEIPGQLTNADYNKEAKVHLKVLPLKLPAKTIQIEMISNQFECSFAVVTAKGDVVAQSNDIDGRLNTRAQFAAPPDGGFALVATNRDGRAVGVFKVIVNEIVQDVYPVVTANFPEYVSGKAIVERDHYRKKLISSGDKYKATVLAWSDAKDLAVLKLNTVPEGVRAVPLAKESAKSGQEVHSIGNPGGSEFLWIYTSGKVRTADAERARFPTGGSGGLFFIVDAWVIQTQSPTNPGDSGGPMISDRGELVAVTQSISGQSANTINNFIDIREVRTLLKNNNIAWVEK